jgi:hypothetical protein
MVTEQNIIAFSEQCKNIFTQIERDVIGQKDIVEETIIAMIAGRIVWGLAMLICMGLDVTKFGVTAFISGALLNAIPGIIIQLVLIPILVITLEKYVKREE